MRHRADACATALTLAPARQITAERLDLEFRPLREKLLVLEHGIVALEPEPIEKSTGLSETVFHEDRVWRIDFFPATHAAWFAVFFVVEIERENELAIFRHIPHKTRAAVVKIVVAIGLAESVLLPVIIVKIVPEGADRAVHFRVIAIIPIAAKHIPGGEMKWRIQARHFHDKIKGSTGLAPVLQSGARTNEFNPLHCVQDWRVMRFRKTKLLVLQGDAIFEHLHELTALRIQTAITEVDDWRLGLFADDNAGRSGHHFPIVIASESGELFRFHERSFLAGIDSRPFYWR